MITEVIVASTVGVLLLILFLVKCFNNNRHSSSANDKNASKFNESANEFENENQQENILTEEKCNQSQEGNGFEGGKKKYGKPKSGKVKLISDTFTHPLLVTSLKGHAGDVTSFDLSSNGKYLISTATDRSIFLWTIKDVGSKSVKSIRANVEFDSARLIKFSPDNRSFITCLENGNCIRVFKFKKNEDGSFSKIEQVMDDFPKTHSADIINIGIDSAGNYAMTADAGTRFDILNLKGDQLSSVDTGTMCNSGAAVSPCGRFVAAFGFTPDVKVWEVSFDRAKEFKGVKRVFDLKGHKAGVLSLAFSADSSRVATLSKDSTWKLWKTDVEYARGQDPVLVCTGAVKDKLDAARIAVSPDGRTVAIAVENNVTLYNGITQEEDQKIAAIFSSEVRHIMFSMNGKYLICCGDRQVKVFNNPTGYKSQISDYTAQLKTCNKNAERRLTEQLEEAKKELKELS